ncbi:MAG: indolepyruvate ferredoxin oxidoreductase subunit alpha [Candidatus Binatia bacterium]
MSILSRLLFAEFPAVEDPQQCEFQRVAIDQEACDGCKMCVIVCPARVLELVRVDGKRKARTLPDIRGCISCNNCMAVCENDAIHATRHYRLTGYYETRGIGEFQPPRTSFPADAASCGER